LRRLVLALGCALPSAAPQEPATFDLVLRAGLVVDGHGGPARRADVAIQAGRIVAVGTVPHDAAAAATLDLAGLTLAPGFIDVHAHADQEALRLPGAENFVAMEVTTIITGKCGSSVPALAAHFTALEREGIALLLDRQDLTLSRHD